MCCFRLASLFLDGFYCTDFLIQQVSVLLVKLKSASSFNFIIFTALYITEREKDIGEI